MSTHLTTTKKGMIKLKLKTMIVLALIAVALFWLLSSAKKTLNQQASCKDSIMTAVSGDWHLDHPVEGVPRDAQTGWADRTASACEHDPKSCSPCSGRPEGICTDTSPHNSGWNNSITGVPGSGMNVKPDGQIRIFKSPAYYGWGPANHFSYGEPFFARAEKY